MIMVQYIVDKMANKLMIIEEEKIQNHLIILFILKRVIENKNELKKKVIKII